MFLGGKWDALDKLDDEPELREHLYAYRRSDPFRGLMDYRGAGGRRAGSAFVIQQYHFVPEQPTQEVMRSTDLWREWTLAQRRAAAPQPVLAAAST